MKKKQQIPHCRDSSEIQLIKIVKRGIIETPNTKIHDRSHSWLGTSTSIKSGEINYFYGYNPVNPLCY
jgi:hypothetical protein